MSSHALFRKKKWLPEDVYAAAEKHLGVLQKIIHDYEVGEKTEKVIFFKNRYSRSLEKLRTEQDAIIGLCCDESNMKEVWEKVIKTDPANPLYLLKEIINIFNLRPHKNACTPKEREKQAERIAKKSKELARLLRAADPAIGASVEYAFSTCIRTDTQKALESICRLQNVNINKNYFSMSYTTSHEALDKIAVTLEKATKDGFHGEFEHSSYPTKIQAENAERSFFMLEVARIVQSIFSEPHYKIAVAIMQTIRPDINTPTANDFSKAVTALRKKQKSTS